MTRFAFILLLFLSVAGCQTAARNTNHSFATHVPQQTKQFWHKTARFLQPLMPDLGNRSGETETLAARRSHADILPISQTPYSLYKAGSIFPSPILAPSSQDEHVLVVETVTPPHLPEPTAEDMVAPLPSEDIVAEIKRSAKPSARQREAELAPNDYEGYEDYEDEPIVRQPARRSFPRQEAEIVAQNPRLIPAPVYPHLAQLPGAQQQPGATPAIVQASYQQGMPPVNSAAGYGAAGYGAGDWQTPTRQAVEQLRYAIEQTPNGRTLSNEMRLRMLEMLLDNRTEASKPMQSADKTVNAFMGNQVLGFAALLDDSMQGRGRYVSAAYRLNEGLMELQNLCPLRLKNVMFVKDWFGFGQFIPRTEEFHPGEPFSVYVELDNPTVRRIADGFEVCVAISYEIRDANARVIVKEDAGKPVDRVISRKRDYVLGFVGTLPTNMAPGQYHLRVNITDMNDDSMQYAEEQIPFRVVPALDSEYEPDSSDPGTKWRGMQSAAAQSPDKYAQKAGNRSQ